MRIEGLVTEKVRVPAVRALVRDRLDGILATARQRRLTLIVAPAGAGKTTLLARFCDTAGMPVAWYQADAADADGERAIVYLDAAFDAVLPGFGSHHSVDELVAALSDRGDPVALVVDDLHALRGTPAEQTLERLIRYFPRHGTVLAASRETPGFDVSRLRLAGDLLEIGGDELRFRTWEVERLFRDFYGAPLPPTELAELARRTAGWAAGLQLFHLATFDKPAPVRRETLAALATRSHLVREYLTRNVLDDLPDHLRSFLLDTCVLEDVTAALCDQLRGTTGSAALLAELDRRQIFTIAVDDCGTYRYHEVLRSHLLGTLLEELGGDKLRKRFVAAGAMLEREGQTAEAAAAYARGGANQELARLLGTSGAALANDPGDWVSSLPAAVTEQDPWIMLAAARWHLGAGRWKAALEEYRRAEHQFGGGTAAEMCRRERVAVNRFLEPDPVLPADDRDRWDVVLRRALQTTPFRFADPVDSTPQAHLAAGLAALLAGFPDRARTLLEVATFDEDTDPMIAAAARLAAAIAPHWAPGSPPAPDSIVPIAKEAESVGGAWLGSIGTACLALTGDAPTIEAAEQELAANCGDIDGTQTGRDPWSALIAGWTCAVGWSEQDPDRAREKFDAVAADARRLGVPTFEAWARSGAAYVAARVGSPDAQRMAKGAESQSRVVGIAGARAVAFAVLAATSSRSEEYMRSLQALTYECGLHVRLPTAEATTRRGTDPTPPELRCLGGLRLRVGGHDIDLTGMKPRWRSLFAVLALQPGRGIHRETLVEMLWPDRDPASAVRSLQVAVSGLRRALPEIEPETGTIVARVGDAYVLRLPSGTRCDHELLRTGFETGRRHHAEGDTARAADILESTLALYEGELLPEEGAAEWVLEPRERCQRLAGDAAQALAEVLVDLDDLAGAARAAATGLSIDRYRDDLWRRRIELLQRTGNSAALERARTGYDAVLAELGLSSATSS